MNTNTNVLMRQKHALNYLKMALYELNSCCMNDEVYNKFINDLSLFKRPLNEVIEILEKVKF